MDVVIAAKKPTWFKKDEPDWKDAENLKEGLEQLGHAVKVVEKSRFKKFPPPQQRGEERVELIKRMIIYILGFAFVGVILDMVYGLYLIMKANAVMAILTYVVMAYMWVVVIIAMIVIMVVYRMRLSPVWVYLKCRKRHDRPLMLIAQKMGRAFLDAGAYLAEVFEYSNIKNPMAFFKNDRVPGYILGEASLGVFYEGAAISQNLEFVLAVEELVRRGYKNIQDVQSDIKAGKFVGDDAKLLIPIFKEVDPASVVEFVQGKPGTLKTYCDTKLNIDRLGQNQPFWQNTQIMAIGYILVCGGIALGIMKSMNVF